MIFMVVFYAHKFYYLILIFTIFPVNHLPILQTDHILLTITIVVAEVVLSFNHVAAVGVHFVGI